MHRVLFMSAGTDGVAGLTCVGLAGPKSCTSSQLQQAVDHSCSYKRGIQAFDMVLMT